MNHIEVRVFTDEEFRKSYESHVEGNPLPSPRHADDLECIVFRTDAFVRGKTYKLFRNLMTIKNIYLAYIGNYRHDDHDNDLGLHDEGTTSDGASSYDDTDEASSSSSEDTSTSSSEDEDQLEEEHQEDDQENQEQEEADYDNAALLDGEIIYDRDFDYDYFGFKTREKWFTLFNAGTPRPQLSSCFLECMKDDSIAGIYDDTLKECGVSVHNIRATGSDIRGTNGTSIDIVPMLRVFKFNDTARYVDQGGGKRKGAFALYLEPWHADIFEFLDPRKNHGKKEEYHYALWVPALFMERVQSNGQWSLFCPNEVPGLADCWGKEFEKLYDRYEREGKAKKIVQGQNLWFDIMKSHIETGTPYMLFKDTCCNKKSNQQNLGTAKSSNLCTEIIEYTSSTETAVCNLPSIALPRYVRDKVEAF